MKNPSACFTPKHRGNAITVPLPVVVINKHVMMSQWIHCPQLSLSSLQWRKLCTLPCFREGILRRVENANCRVNKSYFHEWMNAMKKQSLKEGGDSADVG